MVYKDGTRKTARAPAFRGELGISVASEVVYDRRYFHLVQVYRMDGVISMVEYEER